MKTVIDYNGLQSAKLPRYPVKRRCHTRLQPTVFSVSIARFGNSGNLRSGRTLFVARAYSPTCRPRLRYRQRNATPRAEKIFDIGGLSTFMTNDTFIHGVSPITWFAAYCVQRPGQCVIVLMSHLACCVLFFAPFHNVLPALFILSSACRRKNLFQQAGIPTYQDQNQGQVSIAEYALFLRRCLMQ